MHKRNVPKNKNYLGCRCKSARKISSATVLSLLINNVYMPRHYQGNRAYFIFYLRFWKSGKKTVAINANEITFRFIDKKREIRDSWRLSIGLTINKKYITFTFDKTQKVYTGVCLPHCLIYYRKVQSKKGKIISLNDLVIHFYITHNYNKNYI